MPTFRAIYDIIPGIVCVCQASDDGRHCEVEIDFSELAHDKGVDSAYEKANEAADCIARQFKIKTTSVPLDITEYFKGSMKSWSSQLRPSKDKKPAEVEDDRKLAKSIQYFCEQVLELISEDNISWHAPVLQETRKCAHDTLRFIEKYSQDNDLELADFPLDPDSKIKLDSLVETRELFFFKSNEKHIGKPEISFRIAMPSDRNDWEKFKETKMEKAFNAVRARMEGKKVGDNVDRREERISAVKETLLEKHAGKKIGPENAGELAEGMYWALVQKIKRDKRDKRKKDRD